MEVTKIHLNIEEGLRREVGKLRIVKTGGLLSLTMEGRVKGRVGHGIKQSAGALGKTH